jgi:hypothetical protein
VAAFVRRFLEVMGGHFTELGQQQQQQEEEAAAAAGGGSGAATSGAPAAPTIAPQPRRQPLVQPVGGDGEPALVVPSLLSPGAVDAVVDAVAAGRVGGGDDDVRRALGDRALAAALGDPATAELLRACTASPAALAAALRRPAHASTLRLLARHGLVRFE